MNYIGIFLAVIAVGAAGYALTHGDVLTGVIFLVFGSLVAYVIFSHRSHT